MSDIVERLRRDANLDSLFGEKSLSGEAAVEIERLRDENAGLRADAATRRAITRAAAAIGQEMGK